MSTTIKIDRATFRKNPKAGQRIRGLLSYSVIEHGPYGSRRWEREWTNAGPVAVDYATKTVAGKFSIVRTLNDVDAPFTLGPDEKSFTVSESVIIKEREADNSYMLTGDNFPRVPVESTWLYRYDEASPITCPSCGVVTPCDQLIEHDDDEDMCSWVTCPKCEEEIEGIEREKPEDVAKELGLA